MNTDHLPAPYTGETWRERCRSADDWRREIYARCSPPGRVPPRSGDVIRLNYGTGLYLGYVVERTVETAPGVYHFTVRPNGRSPEQRQACGYLNDFVLRPDGRLTNRPLPPNSSGYHSNGGGRDGDGRDEILIERRAEQGWLF